MKTLIKAGLLFIGLISAGDVIGAEAAATNSNARWPFIASFFKQWDAQPLEAAVSAAEKGDHTAQSYLGRCYSYGQRVQADSEQGLKWYRKASEAGFMPATAMIGQFYFDGAAGERDDQEGLKWLTKAAEGGVPEAQFSLAFYYEKQIGMIPNYRPAVSNSMPVAIKWYRAAAAQNLGSAQLALGNCLLDGKGVEQDEDAGLAMVRQAANDPENNRALVKLADLYSRGIGEPRSESDKPVNLLLRAAKTNVRDAAVHLEKRYRMGLGVERDLPRAAYWLARRWSIQSQIQELSSGRAPQAAPYVKVLSLYLKAIKDDPVATREIAEMYISGQGAPKDPIEASAWLRLAAASGGSGVSERLALVERGLSAEQLELSRARSIALKEEMQLIAKKN